MVMPEIVYLSLAELGTLYSKAELEAISRFVRKECQTLRRWCSSCLRLPALKMMSALLIWLAYATHSISAGQM